MSNAALSKAECFYEEDEKTFSEYEKMENNRKNKPKKISQPIKPRKNLNPSPLHKK